MTVRLGVTDIYNKYNMYNTYHAYPCLCLCRGFVQMTHTRPRLFTVRQCAQIFLTDALTFISFLT